MKNIFPPSGCSVDSSNPMFPRFHSLTPSLITLSGHLFSLLHLPNSGNSTLLLQLEISHSFSAVVFSPFQTCFQVLLGLPLKYLLTPVLSPSPITTVQTQVLIPVIIGVSAFCSPQISSQHDPNLAFLWVLCPPFLMMNPSNQMGWPNSLITLLVPE